MLRAFFILLTNRRWPNERRRSVAMSSQTAKLRAAKCFMFSLLLISTFCFCLCVFLLSVFGAHLWNRPLPILWHPASFWRELLFILVQLLKQEKTPTYSPLFFFLFSFRALRIPFVKTKTIYTFSFLFTLGLCILLRSHLRLPSSSTSESKVSSIVA